MRRISILLVFLSVSGLAMAQPQDWWPVNDYGLDYSLPEDWRSDPFSTSSVCDCPGTINDNGGWIDEKYIGMVIYPVTEAERDSSNRQQIWGYGFVPGEEVRQLEYADIPYTATYGSFLEMKGWPKVLQLVSNDKVGEKCRSLIIYFWAEESVFDENLKTFESILETFERKKVKY